MQNEEHDIAALKQRFLDIYKTSIKREGADKLLDYLLSPKSDFFTAPASTRYHGSYEGGLLQHSLNVYDCLRDYMDRPRVKELYNLTADDEIITGFMRLTREEAFAIRFHMGFSGTEDINLVGRAFEKFPLAYALHAADMEASYFLER